MNGPRNAAWLKKYNELKKFKCREGHCDVPYAFSENKSLGKWVDNQRTQYKYMAQGKPSSMTGQRILYLRSIGFKWRIRDPYDDTWYKRYEELIDYKCREGHCDVPYAFSENESLGRWVNTQRMQYKYMTQGKPSNMTRQRIHHLENIGFKWIITDQYDDVWYKRYEELKEYKCREGHCDVPYPFSENKSLGIWVKTQREQYKFMRQGKPSSIMTGQRIKHLEDIGFKWRIRGHNDDAWYKKYEELKEYKCREGHCDVSRCCNENKSLGYWVSTQKTQYRYMRQGKPSSMTEERMKALSDIGFSWSVSNASKKPEMTPSCFFVPGNWVNTQKHSIDT